MRDQMISCDAKGMRDARSPVVQVVSDGQQRRQQRRMSGTRKHAALNSARRDDGQAHAVATMMLRGEVENGCARLAANVIGEGGFEKTCGGCTCTLLRVLAKLKVFSDLA